MGSCLADRARVLPASKDSSNTGIRCEVEMCRYIGGVAVTIFNHYCNTPLTLCKEKGHRANLVSATAPMIADKGIRE